LVEADAENCLHGCLEPVSRIRLEDVIEAGASLISSKALMTNLTGQGWFKQLALGISNQDFITKKEEPNFSGPSQFNGW